MRRCCGSKARPAAVAAIGGDAAADEDAPLAAELRSLKLSQLLSRAMATASLSETQIQQAQDSEEPRTALVALLLEAENAGSRGAEQRLRNELRGQSIAVVDIAVGVMKTGANGGARCRAQCRRPSHTSETDLEDFFHSASSGMTESFHEKVSTLPSDLVPVYKEKLT